MRPPADRALLAAAGVLVAALALVAAAISFAHMVELATRHGQHGWQAYAFPISVDGLELVASLYLVAQRRAARPTGPVPWIALIVGTLASLTANIAVGGDDPIGKLIAGWPALSFLIAIKLLFGMFDHPADTQRTVPDDHHPPPPPSAAPNSQPTVVPQLDRQLVPQLVPDPDPDADEGPSYTATTDRHPDPAPHPQHRDNRPTDECDPHPADQTPPTHLGDVAQLIPAARQAQTILTAQGRRLSRDALASAMRTAGHPVSNARASHLLKILHAEIGQTGGTAKGQQTIRGPPQMPPRVGGSSVAQPDGLAQINA